MRENINTQSNIISITDNILFFIKTMTDFDSPHIYRNEWKDTFQLGS